MEEYYNFIKYMHIISIISWMAGMLYVPRLFVYHAELKSGHKKDGTQANYSDEEMHSHKLLSLMQKRLMMYITLPAMMSSYIFGMGLVFVQISWGASLGSWFHYKMLAIVGMTISFFMMLGYHKRFINFLNRKTGMYFRIFNEVQTILMLIAVGMVVFR